MKTIEGIIPEEVVSDFGIKNYIGEHLLDIVNNFNENMVWGNEHLIRLFGNCLIQLGTTVENYRQALAKYSSLENPLEVLAFPVIDYVNQEATKHNMHIIE